MSDTRQDFASGSLSRHLLRTTGFMLVTMIVQTMYFLVDLYWVGRLGTDAVAAVSIAGNWSFLVLALTQVLSIGTTSVIAHATGGKNPERARLLFNQSQLLAIVVGIFFLAGGYLIRMPYVRSMGADPATVDQAAEYLLWFIPAMALQFMLVTMGAALRGTGNFRATMIVSTVTIAINMALAPVLIFGWGPAPALGVGGAAVASLVAILSGVVWMALWLLPRESYLRFESSLWMPRVSEWKRLLAIGLPSGIEFLMMTLYLVIIYAIARPFGASAQAGFGVGARIIHAGFMPVVALGFAVTAVAGQNFGAERAERVQRTFRDAAILAAGAMSIFTVVCQIWPEELVGIFSNDPAVIAIGEEYLRITSYNYIAAGFVIVSASMFQAMGNTLPSLVTSLFRSAIVAIPILILAQRSHFELAWVWYLSAAAVWIQLVPTLYFLRREFARRLYFVPSATPTLPAT